MAIPNCIVCEAPLSPPTAISYSRDACINCPRCGQFFVTFPEAFQTINGEIGKSPFRWAITSHAIRRMEIPGGEPYQVREQWVRNVWASETLPNPQMQANAFIEYLGRNSVAGQWIPYDPVAIAGIIGTVDEPASRWGLDYVIGGLQKKGLIETGLVDSGKKGTMGRLTVPGCRLTFEGWERFDEMQRDLSDSKVAFMAMGYGNPTVDLAFNAFVNAVAQTGFLLCRLDQKPKAGLIDLRMRVEIRSAKFLVADLTDENRGAYWEAGFAEGLGKNVYYTCESSKFEATKSHFDTEHLLTVKWSPDSMSEALEELKSAIRNDFPTKAKQLD